MVIGNGLLAKAFKIFKDDNAHLIFASGVSNSTETNTANFKREFNLLKEMMRSHPNFKIIYFSTLSIEDTSVKERPYIQHKLQLENYIKNHANSYLIARISNVVGVGGNSHTIINYLVNAVATKTPIELWNYAERNIIDIDDVLFIIENLLRKGISNKTINIATSKSVLVTTIVKQIEAYLQKEVNATFIDKGNKLFIDVSEISEELAEVEKQKGNGTLYIRNLLSKYY